MTIAAIFSINKYRS